MPTCRWKNIYREYGGDNRDEDGEQDTLAKKCDSGIAFLFKVSLALVGERDDASAAFWELFQFDKLIAGQYMKNLIFAIFQTERNKLFIQNRRVFVERFFIARDVRVSEINQEAHKAIHLTTRQFFHEYTTLRGDYTTSAEEHAITQHYHISEKGENHMSEQERTNDMLDRYGEVCTRTVAAKILGRSARTITAMLQDGRIQTACGGTMVDVRSIAAYICQPRQADELARQRKMGRKWAV